MLQFGAGEPLTSTEGEVLMGGQTGASIEITR
jgi:hypothetical protein